MVDGSGATACRDTGRAQANGTQRDTGPTSRGGAQTP
jgi:hypothetical protein